MNTNSADNPENRGTHGVSPLILTSQDVLSGKHLFVCHINLMEETIMIFDKIKEIVIEQLGVEEDIVTPEANIQDDLGADSLDIVDLIQTIEDEYDLSIPDEAVESIKTVGDIVAYVEKNTDAE